MDVDTSTSAPVNVESMFADPQATPVTDELRRLRTMLLQHCPRESVVKFEFDGRLRLHVDVRRFEDVAMCEALLPTICGGIFHDVQRRTAGHHSFMHRVSAVVEH